MITLLAITGWLCAAILAFGFYCCRLNKERWRKLYIEKRDEVRALESRQLAYDLDHGSLEWYRNETTRLRLKCMAICQQIRRMKGRGKGTCQVDPIHNF